MISLWSSKSKYLTGHNELTSSIIPDLVQQPRRHHLPGHTHEASRPDCLLLRPLFLFVQNISIKKFVSFRKYLNLCRYSCSCDNETKWYPSTVNRWEWYQVKVAVISNLLMHYIYLSLHIIITYYASYHSLLLTPHSHTYQQFQFQWISLVWGQAPRQLMRNPLACYRHTLSVAETTEMEVAAVRTKKAADAYEVTFMMLIDVE